MSAVRVMICGVALVSVFSLTACAVGEKKFSCPGRPAGVHCMTTSQIYEATQTTDVVPPTAPKALGDDPNSTAHTTRASKKSPASSETPTGQASALRTAAHSGTGLNAIQPPPYPVVEAPIPIRVPAQVMRAWIAPWRDSHDRLHGGEKAFLDIASGHWAFGDSVTPVEPVRFFSIQPASAGADTKGSVGKDQSAQPGRVGSSERSKTTSTLPKKETPDDSSQLANSR
jgi:conjugal transfer pilus assembly protein TraV